jgi:chitinase
MIKIKSTLAKVSVIVMTCITALNLSTSVNAQTTTTPPKNIIGFFQSYDDPNAWYFSGTNENLKSSGYTVLVDAFWVNYPYCWGDGSGMPGQGSPIPECKGIRNAPGPGLTNSIDRDFWNNYTGMPAPSIPGDAYNKYWTSLHTTGPQLISHLRNKINAENPNVKILASIGGWNMGGSSEGKPNLPKPPQNPAWAALLKSPTKFANAMSDIVNIKLNNVTLYNGIDIDIETLYGEGCAGSICTKQDELRAINDLAQAIKLFKRNNPTALISVSPRASDLVCDSQYCHWHDTDGVGFVGKALAQLANQGIYFDFINPQFYNDDPARNIPNSIDNDTITLGSQVADMLKKINALGIVGPNTTFNIGVLAQTNGGSVDTGGAPMTGNPGVPKRLANALWTQLKTDPQIVASGIKIDGLMNWAANLAMNNTGIGGNVRSINSPQKDVVPYNWGANIH